MISTLIKSGLKAATRPSTQVQAKRFLYPRIKTIVVRRKTPDELGIAEKVAYGLFFVFVLYSYPFYVMSHLEDYRKGNK